MHGNRQKHNFCHKVGQELEKNGTVTNSMSSEEGRTPVGQCVFQRLKVAGDLLGLLMMG